MRPPTPSLLGDLLQLLTTAVGPQRRLVAVPRSGSFWGIPDTLAMASGGHSRFFWFSSAARGRIEALKSIKCRFLHLFNVGLDRFENAICNTAIPILNFTGIFL
jgi:hypothetical protein